MNLQTIFWDNSSLAQLDVYQLQIFSYLRTFISRFFFQMPPINGQENMKCTVCSKECMQYDAARQWINYAKKLFFVLVLSILLTINFI